MSVGSTHHLEMVFVWKQNYILVDEYFFFCCTWIVNSAYNCGESYSEYDISLSDDENYNDDYYRERPCPGEVFGYDNTEDNDEAASDYALKINENSD
uniref:Uncharacterized protein n=4 Tax=Escherichia coli TaxID=562 RepID=A0A1U9XD64_ECOLX|nr:hypothetical protein [Escherichia coli]